MCAWRQHSGAVDHWATPRNEPGGAHRSSVWRQLTAHPHQLRFEADCSAFFRLSIPFVLPSGVPDCSVNNSVPFSELFFSLVNQPELILMPAVRKPWRHTKITNRLTQKQAWCPSSLTRLHHRYVKGSGLPVGKIRNSFVTSWILFILSKTDTFMMNIIF